MGRTMAFIVVVSLLVFNVISTVSSECGMTDFNKCAEVISQMERENGCSQLQKSMKCLEDLLVKCGLHKDSSASFCDGEEPYEYCGLMDGAQHAPMAPSTVDGVDSICHIYVRMKTCNTKECGPSGNKFKQDPRFSTGSRSKDKSCSGDAIKKCAQHVEEVTEVNSTTCPSVASARSCLHNDVERCSGDDVEQYTVDVVMNGMNYHVKQCKAKKISFSTDGGFCVPNPFDVFVTEDMKSSDGVPKGVNKENCRKVLTLGDNLDNYMANCNVTDITAYAVKEVLSEINGPRIQCLKAGYGKTGGSVTTRASEALTLLAGGVVLLIHTLWT